LLFKTLLKLFKTFLRAIFSENTKDFGDISLSDDIFLGAKPLGNYPGTSGQARS
jgi:hypothetical protein